MTDSPDAVITECDLPESPEKVWKALTVPELLAAWLPEAVDCEILAAEPDRLLCYRWRAAGQDRDAARRVLDSVVIVELTGTATGGTHLRVDHRVLAVVVPFKLRKRPVTSDSGGARARGRTYDEVERTLDRDYFMSAEEAREWGLVDHVYKSRDSLQAA